MTKPTIEELREAVVRLVTRKNTAHFPARATDEDVMLFEAINELESLRAKFPPNSDKFTCWITYWCKVCDCPVHPCGKCGELFCAVCERRVPDERKWLCSKCASEEKRGT